jgi:hypothetical protein
MKSSVAVLIISVGILQLSAICPAKPRLRPQNNSVAGAIARPCKIISSGLKPLKKASKGKQQKLEDEDGDSSGACLEVHSTALEVQEYLQAQAREQKWSLTEEHVAEDAWRFSRKLEKDELLQATKKDGSTARVNWSSGLAFIQVRTTELDDGFVRVQVSARFQGYGQNTDSFAPPKDTWPLKSNFALENNLISILEAHFKLMR